ncbi:MAG: hypothetical protein O7E54_07645, partial [Planctomycetota bacterium]|nr:hypothetical protein [Planctomycetota bacterium]
MKRLVTLVLPVIALLCGSLAMALESSREFGLNRARGSFFVTLEEGANRGPFLRMLRARGARVRHEYRIAPNRF